MNDFILSFAAGSNFVQANAIIDELHELIKSPAVQVALVAITVFGVIISIIKSIKKWTKPKPKTQTHKFRDIKSVEKKRIHFIPNHIAIYSTSLPLEAISTTNSITYLTDTFIPQDNTRFYFLEASTGVGKTTYLCNLYFALKRSRKKSRRQRVLLAHYNDLLSHDDNLLTDYITRDLAKHTVLLVDAMDEFTASGNLGTAEYWRDFHSLWTPLSNLLLKFKKVIITVREQFLDERNVIGHHVATEKFKRIKLLPFTVDQSMAYVNDRYKNDEKLKDIKWLLQRIQYLNAENEGNEKHLFIGIPLILSYAKDVYNAYEKVKAADYSIYAIYEAIISGWLDREILVRNINEIDRNNILRFCQRIAFDIAKSGEGGGISSEKLRALSKGDHFFSIFNHGERTLLKKEEVVQKLHTGTETVTHRFEFTHRAFMEFFLAQLALQSEHDEKEIPFERYELAAHMFIRKRWLERKPLAYDIFKDVPIVQEHNGDQNSIPDITALKALYAVFANFSTNRYIQTLLHSQEKGSGLFLLEGKSYLSVETFGGLKSLKLNNDNFWNSTTNTPDETVFRLIPLIKDFITIVSICELPLSDQMLSCFNGAQHISVLELTKNNLDGSCLKYFKESKYSLLEFALSQNNITDDEMFSVLDGINALDLLALNDNRLKGSFSAYFQHCKSSLRRLDLRNNALSEDTMLKPLMGTNTLKELYLGDNKLDGSCLSYFSESKETLQIIEIRNSGITDDHVFSPFSGAANLEQLWLAENRLTGACVSYFKSSIGSLKILDLDSNQSVTDPMLAPLAGISGLQELYLGGNKISGSCLAYFSASKHSLVKLGLANSGISDDTLLAPFDGANNLMIINLNGNGLTGACLKYFKDSKSTLMVLNLGNNQISDPGVFNPLDGATNLWQLNVNFNKLSHGFLDFFKNSTATFEQLYAGQNLISDPEILKPLTNMTRLKIINLLKNPIVGKIDVAFLNKSRDTIEEFWITFKGDHYNIRDQILTHL